MLDIALKEWAVVCDLLLEGRLAVLLRKGGIDETGGPGVFELEHRRFVLFPSWAHQKPQMVKASYRERVEIMDEPAEIPFRGWATAGEIWRVTDRSAFDQLDDLHCWTSQYVDMRFNYKPDRPLYLVAIRAYRLAQPKTVSCHAQYTGCRSWVPLRVGDEVEDYAGEPVMEDQAFDQVVKRISKVMK